MPPDELIPMVLGAMTLLIPIVALLTAHQRKMTELMAKSGRHVDAGLQAEVAALKAEVASLRGELHRQALAMDDMRRQEGSIAAR